MADIKNVQFLDKVGLSQLWKHVKENDIDATVAITRGGEADTASFVPGENGAKGKLSINLADFPAATVTALAEDEKVLSLNDTKLSTDFTTKYDSSKNRIYLLGKANSDLEKGYGEEKRAILGEVDTTDFVKDGMLSNVELVVVPDPEPAGEGHQEAGTYLKFTFNVNDPTGVHGHKDIYVNVTDLIDVYGVEDGGYLTLSEKKEFALDVTAKKAVTNYVDATACFSDTAEFVTVTGNADDHSLKIAAVTTDAVSEVNTGSAPSTNKLATSKLVQAAYKELDDNFANYVLDPKSTVGSVSKPVYYDHSGGEGVFKEITSLNLGDGQIDTTGATNVGSLKSTGAIEAVGATFTGDVNATGHGVTADTFTGALKGTADKADALAVVGAVGSVSKPVYIDEKGKPQAIESLDLGSGAANVGSVVATGNIKAATMTADTFTGALVGNADTATTASKVNNALTVNITDGAASEQSAVFDGSAATSIDMKAFTADDIDEILGYKKQA